MLLYDWLIDWLTKLLEENCRGNVIVYIGDKQQSPSFHVMRDPKRIMVNSLKATKIAQYIHKINAYLINLLTFEPFD